MISTPCHSEKYLDVISMKYLKLGRFFLLCLVLFLSQFHTNRASAGPDAATEFFMDEQASLFSFGMYRLEQQFANTSFPEGFAGASTRYDWDEDEIVIQIMSYIGINSNQEAREKCRTAIGTIRSRCGVNSDTGEKYLGDETSSWCAANFARIGFQRSGDEEKLAELDKKLRIECVVFGDASVKMSGKLLSSKIVEEVN